MLTFFRMLNRMCSEFVLCVICFVAPLTDPLKVF